MSWEASNRRARLPANWRQIRKRILARDKWCKVCELNRSDDVDHIVAGDDHSDPNLRGICYPCHSVKSAREGAIASGKARRAMIAARKRPQESHPGGL